MANPFPEGIPTDEEFTREFLAGVGDADSMMFAELLAIELEAQDDQSDLSDDEREQARSQAFDELFALDSMPEREQRMHIMHRLLASGSEIDTTIFGMPVLITPIDDVQPPPPPLEPDNEPLQPLPAPPELQAHAEAS